MRKIPDIKANMTGSSLAGLVCAAVLFLALSGCAPRHTVVLVPDPDGRIGKAEVLTEGGSQSLVKASDMTRVSGRSAAPSAVMTADSAYIAATFADVIAIEPHAPEKFTLFFETGGTDLLPESKAVFSDVLAAIKRLGAISVSVSGHADASGSVQINDALARDRAQAVSDMLVQNGVSPDILNVTSHGKGNPLVPTPDGVAEPRNRRVEVIVR